MSSQLWNGGWGKPAAPAPTVLPTVIQTSQQADNSTPLGRGIPKGIGTFGAKCEIVIDPDLVGGVRLVNGRYLVNLVLNCFDSDLGGSASLVWLKANDEFIYRAQAPQRSPSSPMRIYGGNQTAVDPLITQYFTAEYRTMWPGMGYIVLEDFDITPYSDGGSTIPTFTSAWSTDANEVAASEDGAILTFGEFADPWTSSGYMVDWSADMVYHIIWLDYNLGSASFAISAVSISDNTEKWRVPVTSPIAFDYMTGLRALPGTNYAVGLGDFETLGFTLTGAFLINLRTGVIVSVAEAITDGSGRYYEPSLILSPVRIRSDSATVFMALASTANSGPIPPKINTSFCYKIDVTNETITAVNDPVGNPPRGLVSTDILWTTFTIAELVSVSNGRATFLAKESSINNIIRVVVGESGVTSVEDYFIPPSDTFTSVVFDPVQSAIVYSTSTQLVSLDFATLAENYRVTPSIGTSLGTGSNQIRPGYAVGFRSSGSDLRFLVDLSDGSMTAISGLDEGYYSQYQGVAVYQDIVGVESQIYFIRYGDLTPNTVDAVDILTALMTYQGHYSVGDLTFTGFAGNECYGLQVASDATIDELISDVCEALGVRHYHDAGKVHFVMPARDGSFAIDKALDSNDIAVDRIRQQIADQDAAIKDCYLDYFDIDADFERVTQSYIRPTGVYQVTASSRVERKSTMLVMDAPQAMRQAWRMTYESEYDRVTYSFRLAPRRFDIVPADNVSFTFGARAIAGQVRSSRLRRDLSQDVVVTQALQAVENAAVGVSLIAPPVLDQIAGQLLVLDTALLSLADDTSGSGLRGYAVFLGLGEDAISTSIGYKSPLGIEYTGFGTVSNIATLSGTISGITRNTATDAETDFAASLTVSVASGDISTMANTDEPGRYSRENFAAIGAAGRWVLISYGTVSVSGQVATLGEIVWGIQGTDAYFSQLVDGDMFINLEPNEVLKFTNPTLGATVYYKGGLATSLVNQMPTIAKVANGEAEKPFAAVQAAYSDAGSTRTITWEPRERLSIMPVLYGSQSFGYSEGGEDYEIDLLNGSTVLTTLTAASPTVDYDTGTYSATSAKIYQMGLAGSLRGHPATLTF